MYIFLKYLVTLFYKKLRIKLVVSLLRESGPWPNVPVFTLLFPRFILLTITKSRPMLIATRLLDPGKFCWCYKSMLACYKSMLMCLHGHIIIVSIIVLIFGSTFSFHFMFCCQIFFLFCFILFLVTSTIYHFNIFQYFNFFFCFNLFIFLYFLLFRLMTKYYFIASHRTVCHLLSSSRSRKISKACPLPQRRANVRWPWLR